MKANWPRYWLTSSLIHISTRIESIPLINRKENCTCVLDILERNNIFSGGRVISSDSYELQTREKLSLLCPCYIPTSRILPAFVPLRGLNATTMQNGPQNMKPDE